MTYTIKYHNKAIKEFKIEGPDIPAYFAKGCRETGLELSHLKINTDDISFLIEDLDANLIRSFIHHRKVLGHLKPT